MVQRRNRLSDSGRGDAPAKLYRMDAQQGKDDHIGIPVQTPADRLAMGRTLFYAAFD